MKVVKLYSSVRVPDRWYMELEGGETLKITTGIIADFSVFTGREFEESELDKLRSEAGEHNARLRALRMVSSRQMSRREVVDKLKSKGETEENAHLAADFLERTGAVNDVEYAASIVRHYSKKGYGEARIRSELSRRGVDRELWQEAFCQMYDTTEAVDTFINQRLRDKTPDRKEIKKITDALLRRGFSYSDIREALRRNCVSEEED